LRIFDVTHYGAVGDGKADSAPGVQRAIDAAQAAGGAEVYLPAGDYLDANGATIEIHTGPAVTLAGSGRDSTRLIQGVAAKGLLSVKADHSIVQDLTLDAHAHDGGSAFGTGSSYVTLRRCKALGGTQVWAVRFAGGHGVAKPTAPSYERGNVVDDLVLHDYAPGQNDGLDFSYQKDGTITNVQHTGSRLGLFVDSNVAVTNYSYAPEPTLPSGTFGFYITAPGDHITITNFTSSGQGGKVGVIPPGSPRKGNTDITIRGERMTGGAGYHLFVGDVTNLVIQDSTLGGLEIAPNLEAQIVLKNTTTGSVTRRPASGATIDVRQ
jgi:hypothetical protein